MCRGTGFGKPFGKNAGLTKAALLVNGTVSNPGFFKGPRGTPLVIPVISSAKYGALKRMFSKILLYMRSKNAPHPARNTNFWFPNISHAKPMRGPKLLVSLFQILLLCTWNVAPASYEYHWLFDGKNGLQGGLAHANGVTRSPKQTVA